ncbi:hypothetical protein ONZ45_g8763 [Pleurotus djamor]|nr:hypothetical protein ONZ45_g8763 [Pleurotus djamor]
MTSISKSSNIAIFLSRFLSSVITARSQSAVSKLETRSLWTRWSDRLDAQEHIALDEDFISELDAYEFGRIGTLVAYLHKTGDQISMDAPKDKKDSDEDFSVKIVGYETDGGRDEGSGWRGWLFSVLVLEDLGSLNDAFLSRFIPDALRAIFSVPGLEHDVPSASRPLWAGISV